MFLFYIKEMDYKRNLLLFTNQIEKKIIYNGKSGKLI